MQIIGWVATLLLGVLMGGPHTLREQLQDAGIPEKSFSEAELNQKVDGSETRNNQTIYFVYIRRNGDELTGNPQVVRYNIGDNVLLRSEIKPEDENLCCGSPEGMEIVDDFLLLTFHFNPSAASVVVLDKNLKTIKTLYGFGVERVATDQVVFTENMIHFAPVHAERLQFVDLRSSAAEELYPPSNDALRTTFNEENTKRMPPDDICQSSENDLCDPQLYDDDAEIVSTNGNGGFALVANWNSSHAIKKGSDPVTIASASVLYLYEHHNNRWLFCDQKITDDEATTLINSRKNSYELLKSRCTPRQTVISDTTTDEFSPFPKPSRRMK